MTDRSDHDDGPFLLGCATALLISAAFWALICTFGLILWIGGWL